MERERRSEICGTPPHAWMMMMARFLWDGPMCRKSHTPLSALSTYVLCAHCSATQYHNVCMYCYHVRVQWKEKNVQIILANNANNSKNPKNSCFQESYKLLYFVLVAINIAPTKGLLLCAVRPLWDVPGKLPHTNMVLYYSVVVCSTWYTHTRVAATLRRFPL